MSESTRAILRTILHLASVALADELELSPVVAGPKADGTEHCGPECSTEPAEINGGRSGRSYCRAHERFVWPDGTEEEANG